VLSSSHIRRDDAKEHEMDRYATNLLWQEHVERLRGLYTPPPTQPVIADAEAEEARRGEWTASPPGRLGRRLLADVEPWLEFFAIARG
jgi:hypothetical protein